MAVTFLVEDGTIVAGATSYVSVSDADDIAAIDLLRGDKWSALSSPVKEKWLMFATRYLDRMFGWLGEPVEDTQPLGWPRTGTKDRNGIAIGSGVVPDEIKEAVVEVVLFHLSSPLFKGGFDPVAVKRFRADTFEIELQDGATFRSMPSDLLLILAGLVFERGGVGFKKIKRV